MPLRLSCWLRTQCNGLLQAMRFSVRIMYGAVRPDNVFCVSANIWGTFPAEWNLLHVLPLGLLWFDSHGTLHRL